jgi:phenylacetate-CoA ligase
LAWRDSAGDFFKQSLGSPVGSRTGFLWGHHLDPVANDRLRDRYYSFVTNVRWFDCFRLSPEVLESYHREFERWKPACIVAYASALGALAEYVRDRGYRPGYPSRCLITGGEKLLPHHRQAVESVFESPVYERYGSRDAGYIGFQREPARSLDFEIDWSNLLVEPETDETQSSVLITKLHADGFPMLRYRIGDMARFPETSRPGHPALSLNEVLGRDADRIWLPDGRWVHGLEMPHLIKDYPVRAFNVVQRADYSIEVNIVPRNSFGDESRRSLLALMAMNFQGLPIKIEMVEEIPRTKANKWRPVISEVKMRQGRPA